MKIVFISDTHTQHDYLTEILNKIDADTIVHSGDVSYTGTYKEVYDFINWYKKLKFKNKIFIAGNHDFLFDTKWNPRTITGSERHRFIKYSQEDIDLLLKDTDITYLNDSGVEIDGIKFWGSPITPWFHDWAFNRYSYEIGRHWDLIPEKTDVLITHGPPYKILDKVIYGGHHTGCELLLEKIKQVKPKIHVFGHIHEQYGVFEDYGVKFINASVLTVKYEMVNNPIVIEI